MQADDYTQYLLRDHKEIVFILRQLAARRNNITAYFGDAQKFLLTTLLGISQDEKEIFLDLGPDTALNAQAIASQHLLCLTQLEKVKIQFPLDKFELSQFERYPALRCALPDMILRLQRREYYRLAAPSSHPLACRIPITPGSNNRIEARVLDISGGGIAVIVPPRELDFQTEHEFPDCRLELPEFGFITATLRIRNIFKITQPNGTEVLRAGCQFVDLSPAVANTIQRYILKVERERKARELGN